MEENKKNENDINNNLEEKEQQVNKEAQEEKKEINLQDVVKLQKEKIDEQEDRIKRIMAEFENFKKRSLKERETLYNSLVSDIFTSILPVIDNLEKAVASTTQDEAYKQGVELVLKQFKDVLRQNGVEEIEAIGNPFDPSLHEAVATTVDKNLGEKIVKEEYRKGYRIGSKVIRHSMVIVAN